MVADEDTRKKLKFKKTETSRLKTAGAPESGDPVVGKSPPPQPDAAGDDSPAVADPMALRDTNTSKVRRVQATNESGTLATAVAPGTVSPERKTETVQLKVVQQKKKEIADMMSPSSTVRLRAPGSSGTGGPEIEVPKPQPVASARETLKIPVPGRPAAPTTTAEVEVPEVKKTATRAITQVKDETPDTGGTGRQTLKIKAQPKPGRTIKVGGGAKSKAEQTVALPKQEGEAAQTVKVEGGAPAGLKLRERDATAPTSSVLTPMPMQGSTTGNPGVLFTLAAVVTVVAMGALLFFLAVQFKTHMM